MENTGLVLCFGAGGRAEGSDAIVFSTGSGMWNMDHDPGGAPQEEKGHKERAQKFYSLTTQGRQGKGSQRGVWVLL